MAQNVKGNRFIDEDEDAEFDAVLVKNADKKSLGILPKIVALLLAIIVWLFVMEVNPPDVRATYEDIPVLILNASGYTVVPKNEEDLTVDVVVTGKKNRIHSLNEQDITLVIDAGKITESGEYQLEVQCAVPGEFKIYKLSVNTITVIAVSNSGET